MPPSLCLNAMRSHLMDSKAFSLWLGTLHRKAWWHLGLALVTCALVFWCSFLAPVGFAQDSPELPTVTESITDPDPGSVTLNGEVLFTLQDPAAAVSIEERAARISERLLRAAQDLAIPVEALTTGETELGTAIYAEDSVLLALSEADAANTGQTPAELAATYRSLIQAAIQNYRSERSAEYLTRATIVAALCTLGLILAILVLANVMPQFSHWLDRQQDRWIPNVRLFNFDLLTAHQLTALVQAIAKALHWALVVGLILVYLPYVLSLFPQTRTLGQSLFGYVMGALQIVWRGFINYLPNLLSILIILIVTSTLLRFARWIFASIRRGSLRIPGFYPEWATPTFRLVQFLVIAFALAIIFPYLPGADSPAFQGVSIFLGLLVSLGAGGAIFSIVAGFILVYTRAFTEGDRIRFGDIEGFVEEKSLFVTRIRTLENVLVSVPNASLLNSNIGNYSALIRERQTPIVLKTTITLGYDVPWQLVHKTLIAAADATSYVLKDPPPQVWQTSLDDFYVSYQLRACTIHPEELDATYSELHQNLQDYCNQAGIEIMSPHYGAIRDGNQSTIPASYLPDDYQPSRWNLPFP